MKTFAIVAAMGLGLATPSLAAERACPEAGFALVEKAGAPDTRVVIGPRDEALSVPRQAATATADIAEVTLEEEPDGAALRLKFKPAGAARLQAATTNIDGRRLAFVVDGRAVMVVTWTGAYGLDSGRAQISMRDPRLARSVAADLRRCIAAG